MTISVGLIASTTVCNKTEFNCTNRVLFDRLGFLDLYCSIYDRRKRIDLWLIDSTHWAPSTKKTCEIPAQVHSHLRFICSMRLHEQQQQTKHLLVFEQIFTDLFQYLCHSFHAFYDAAFIFHRPQWKWLCLDDQDCVGVVGLVHFLVSNPSDACKRTMKKHKQQNGVWGDFMSHFAEKKTKKSCQCFLIHWPRMISPRVRQKIPAAISIIHHFSKVVLSCWQDSLKQKHFQN